VKVFGLSVGFGFPMRAVTIYERGQAELFAPTIETRTSTGGRAPTRRRSQP
jgi:hypothetical protein